MINTDKYLTILAFEIYNQLQFKSVCEEKLKESEKILKTQERNKEVMTNIEQKLANIQGDLDTVSLKSWPS